MNLWKFDLDTYKLSAYLTPITIEQWQGKMNLEYKHDRVGPDHSLRKDFRNFLLVLAPDEGSALDALQEGKDVSPTKVADELQKLVDVNYSIDYVYQFSTEDIRSFLNYTNDMIKAEKALTVLKKACKLAFDAGINHGHFQGHLVDFYEEISNTKDFVDRFSIKKEW